MDIFDHILSSRRKSLKEKIDDIKVNYPEIYYKCFKNEDEANEYIERLVKKL